MNSLTPYLKNSILLLLIIFTVSCKRRPQAVEKVEETGTGSTVTVKKARQGVSGKIIFKEGQFSSSGEILDNGKVYGIERDIFFYELTNIKDVEIGDGDFVKYTSSEIIDSVSSDKHGNFSKELPEGKYSIFIKESKRLYSKLDDDDYYFPVTVLKDSNTTVVIEVDYKASYLTGR